MSCDVFQAVLGMMVHCAVQCSLKANADKELGVRFQLTLDLILLGAAHNSQILAEINANQMSMRLSQ